jgi:soluble lytic murein transglycosylase-like protein
MRTGLITTLATMGLVLSAGPARADLVFFSTGRTLSVKAVKSDGASLILTLRSGGEIVCDRSVIAHIEADEVPYPEPQADLPPAAAPVVVAVQPAVPYGEIIDRVASEQKVPAGLVRAVIQAESNYQERARSPKGAMGLMQLMPATARQFAVADPYEASSNIEGGIRYLRSLLDRFELPLALAAYNAGEAAVRRFGGIPPYPETREYVERVLRNFQR